MVLRGGGRGGREGGRGLQSVTLGSSWLRMCMCPPWMQVDIVASALLSVEASFSGSVAGITASLYVSGHMVDGTATVTTTFQAPSHLCVTAHMSVKPSTLSAGASASISVCTPEVPEVCTPEIPGYCLPEVGNTPMPLVCSGSWVCPTNHRAYVGPGGWW